VGGGLCAIKAVDSEYRHVACNSGDYYMPATEAELEKAIDELIAESGLDAEEVADMLESMALHYREQADDEEEAGDE